MGAYKCDVIKMGAYIYGVLVFCQVPIILILWYPYILPTIFVILETAESNWPLNINRVKLYSSPPLSWWSLGSCCLPSSLSFTKSA